MRADTQPQLVWPDSEPRSFVRLAR
jgi:hypothetical protein